MGPTSSSGKVAGGILDIEKDGTNRVKEENNTQLLGATSSHRDRTTDLFPETSVWNQNDLQRLGSSTIPIEIDSSSASDAEDSIQDSEGKLSPTNSLIELLDSADEECSTELTHLQKTKEKRHQYKRKQAKEASELHPPVDSGFKNAQNLVHGEIEAKSSHEEASRTINPPARKSEKRPLDDSREKHSRVGPGLTSTLSSSAISNEHTNARSSTEQEQSFPKRDKICLL